MCVRFWSKTEIDDPCFTIKTCQHTFCTYVLCPHLEIFFLILVLRRYEIVSTIPIVRARFVNGRHPVVRRNELPFPCAPFGRVYYYIIILLLCVGVGPLVSIRGSARRPVSRSASSRVKYLYFCPVHYRRQRFCVRVR